MICTSDNGFKISYFLNVPKHLEFLFIIVKKINKNVMIFFAVFLNNLNNYSLHPIIYFVGQSMINIFKLHEIMQSIKHFTKIINY